MKRLSETMGPVLAQVASRSGQARALGPLWTRVVGEVLAAHTAPRSLAQGVLTVGCESAAWKDALEAEREGVLKRLRASVGDGRLIHTVIFEVSC